MIRQDWSTLKKLMFMKAAAGGGSAAVERIALGNPLTFGTDLARPLVSLEIPFTPKQSGSGDPSPSNIRSILPWNGLTVFGGGKNLFNKDDPNVQLDKRVATGGTIINSQYSQAVTGFIPVKEGAKYIINSFVNQNYFSCFYSEKDISNPVGSIWGNNEFPKTAPKGAKYLIVTIGNSGIDNFQVEVGTTATAYEPYSPITETDIAFASPVYGGTLDAVTGVLMNGWKVETLDDANAWTQGAYISYSNHDFSDRKKGSSWLGLCSAFPIKEGVASGTAFARWGGADAGNFIISPNGSGLTLEDVKTLSGQGKIVLAYPIATPQEIQLTPSQITALIGNNTIWSDADGSMTCVYLVSSKYAEDHPVGVLSSGLGSGLLGSNPDPDEPIENPEENPEE